MCVCIYIYIYIYKINQSEEIMHLKFLLKTINGLKTADSKKKKKFCVF